MNKKQCPGYGPNKSKSKPEGLGERQPPRENFVREVRGSGIPRDVSKFIRLVSTSYIIQFTMFLNTFGLYTVDGMYFRSAPGERCLWTAPIFPEGCLSRTPRSGGRTSRRAGGDPLF